MNFSFSHSLAKNDWESSGGKASGDPDKLTGDIEPFLELPFRQEAQLLKATLQGDIEGLLRQICPETYRGKYLKNKY